MQPLLQIDNKSLFNFSHNWNKFLIWGTGFVILGCLAIAFTSISTFLSIEALGLLLLLSGIIVIVDLFQFWNHSKSSPHMRAGFYLQSLISIIYICSGIVLIKHPVVSSFSLTLFLANIFILLGVFRIIYSLYMRLPGWGWNFTNGIITLLLGMLIISDWPTSSLYIIGLFVGIDLLTVGLSYVMIALHSRDIVKSQH